LPKGSSDETADVVVVVVTYNPGEHILRCISAVLAQTYTRWEAIVWDNASTDRAVEAAPSDPRLSVVCSPVNLGFAAACNRAAKMSKAPYIALLNPDAFPEADWLEKLVSAARIFRADAVGSLQLVDDDPGLLDGAGDCMSVAGIAWRGGYRQTVSCGPVQAVEIFSPCAAAALYRRDTFERLGGLEERFFCYYEDVDLGFRIQLSGGRCILEPKAVVRHIGSASSSKINGFAEYHGTRNRLWTFMRDMPLLLMPIALPLHVLTTLHVLLRSHTPELRDARWRGFRDGWRGRHPWLSERRMTPIWMRPSILVWSPLEIRRRRPKYLSIRT